MIKNAKNQMLAWSPESGEVRLISWPDMQRQSQGLMTCLACDIETRQSNFEQRQTIVFIQAIHLIVRDKINPMKLHDVLMELEEYKQSISTDMVKS